MEGSAQITKFLLGFPLRPVGISKEEIFLAGMPMRDHTPAGRRKGPRRDSMFLTLRA